MDWTDWQTYAVIVGFLVALVGFVWAGLNRGTVKGIMAGLGVIAIGVVVIFVGFVVPVASTAASVTPTPVPGASVIVTIPTGSYGHEIGSANSAGFSVNTATHVITGTMFWNSTSSTFKTKTTAGAIGTFAIPIVLSRSDGQNTSAGFNIFISNIYTQANTTNGILYSPISYTPATGSSAGVWGVTYTNGSLNGASPSVAAPATTTFNPDLLGVSAYGSAGMYATFTLGGSSFYNLQIAQYTSFSFTMTVTNSATGVSQGSYTVTLTDASAPPTGTL
jgi:uncharacterized membrane protein